jgi:hypothetical protein
VATIELNEGVPVRKPPPGLPGCCFISVSFIFKICCYFLSTGKKNLGKQHQLLKKKACLHAFEKTHLLSITIHKPQTFRNFWNLFVHIYVRGNCAIPAIVQLPRELCNYLGNCAIPNLILQ